MTHPIAVDPYEVAYLRGGRNELARVIVISLVERQFLELHVPDTGLLKTFVAGTKHIRQRNPHALPALSEMERTVYGWFREPRTTAEIFRQSLPDQLSRYCLTFEERLQRQQLLRGDDAPRWPVVGIVARLRHVFRKRLTARGREYLAQVRSQTLASPEPAPFALAAAIGGASALAPTPLSDLGAEFRKGQHRHASGCSGGVWGGSGCGGGGCGASGCGGGGGGCGGGGGGCGGG